MKVILELEDKKDLSHASRLLRSRPPFLDGYRKLYIVTDGTEPLAVAIMGVDIKKFVYITGGVNQRGRDLHAGDKLFWGLMQDVKHIGYTIFDMGGIFADWASDEEKKVNIFKERWGGKIVKINKRNES